MSDSVTLRGWLDAKGHSDAECARLLGVSPSHLSLVLSGARRPSLELAGRIEDLTGGAVAARSWLPKPQSTETCGAAK